MPQNIFEQHTIDNEHQVYSQTPLDGVAIPLNHGLSELEKAYIMLFYPYVEGPGGERGGWSLLHALDVVGVDKKARERILKMSNPDSIRQLFIEWNEDISLRLVRRDRGTR